MERAKEQGEGGASASPDTGTEVQGSTTNASFCRPPENADLGAQRPPLEDPLFFSETSSSFAIGKVFVGSTSTAESRLPGERCVNQYDRARGEVQVARSAVEEAVDRCGALWDARNNAELRANVVQLKISARYSRAKADRATKFAEKAETLGANIDVALVRTVKSHHRAEVVLAEKTAAASRAGSEEAPAAAVCVDERKRSLHEDANIAMSKVVKADCESAGGAAHSRMRGEYATSAGAGQHVAPAKGDAQRNGLAKATRSERKLASELAELQQLKSANAKRSLDVRARATALTSTAIHDAHVWHKAEAAAKGSFLTEAYDAAIRDLRRKRAALADAEQEELGLERIFLKAEHAAAHGQFGSKRIREAISHAESELLRRRKKKSKKAEEEEVNIESKTVALPFLEGLDRLTPALAYIEWVRSIEKGLGQAGVGRANGAEERAEPRRSTRETRGKPAEVFES